MNRKLLVLALFAALAIFTLKQADACTIFVLTDGKRVVFCNNEDWSNPKSRIWFVPAGDDYFGCAYVGFDNGWAQGGLNTKGLAFDWVAGSMQDWQPGSEMKVVQGNPSARMLETCATVDEAVAYFFSHKERSFGHAKILVADSSGKSVILGVKDSKLQVEEASECRGFGYGQRTLDKMLATMPEPTAVAGSGILRACLQDGGNATKYSNVFDLKSGDIYLIPFPKRSDNVKMNLATELKKGEHFYDIPELSQQVTQTPRPLLTNMKRLFMNQFKTIPDADSAVTERIRGILQDLLNGSARPEDFTDEFWNEIQHDKLRAITEFKLLGMIGALTLVDRKVEGETRSYRYLAEFRGLMEMQVRFVLDQKSRVALVELEGAQWK